MALLPLVLVWLLHGTPDAGRNGRTVVVRLHRDLLEIHLRGRDVLMAQRFLHRMQAPRLFTDPFRVGVPRLVGVERS